MAVRQYVGARYVPKFADPYEWQADTGYEALTVVTYNNASYTSKVPVPPTVGNPANNPLYWALTGNYNAQVEDYRQTTLQYKEQTDENTTNIQNETTNRENADNEINEKITTLTNELPHADSLKNRYFVFLGDSYYLGTMDGQVQSNSSWCNLIIGYMGLTPDQYTRATLTDITSSSTTATFPAFYPSTETHRSFTDILKLVVGHMTEEEIAKTTDVVVAGGYNELQNSSATYAGMQEYFAYAKTVFPKARLWCSFIGWTSAQNNQRIDLLSIKTIYEQCVLLGGTYLDASLRLPYAADFSADNVHPSVQGYINIAVPMASQLLFGSDIHEHFGVGNYTSITFDNAYIDGDTSKKTIEPIVRYFNGCYYFSINCLLYIETAQTGNIQITGKYTNLLIPRGYLDRLFIVVTGASFGTGQCGFEPTDNSVHLTIGTTETTNVFRINHNFIIPVDQLVGD